MKNRMKILSYLAGIALLQCTSLSNVAGRGGSETTNGVTVCIFYNDGTVAAGVQVRLRPSEYLSATPGGAATGGFWLDTITDGSGRLSMYRLPAGSYCVEVKNSSSDRRKAGAFLHTFKIGPRDTIAMGNDTLRAFTAIEGSIDTMGVGAGVRFAQVRGLERIERIADDGSFAIRELPAGNFSVRIVAAGATPNAREVANVKTHPGDTARVEISGAWTRAKRIYFNSTATGANIAGDIYDFPVFLSLDTTTFDFGTALAHGEDIRFSNAEGKPLAYEIEEWNSGEKRAAVWVRIDTVFGNSLNRYILMTWGERAASSLSSGAAVFDTAEGFVGVWHLGDAVSGAQGEIKDATANNLDGQGGGGSKDSLPVLIPGLSGLAQSYNGHSSYVRVHDAEALHIDSSLTVSFWVYYRKIAADNQRFISKDGDWSVKENANRPQFTIGDTAYLVADTALSQNSWYFITVVAQRLDGAVTATMYVNGKETGSYETTFPLYVSGRRVMDDHLYFGQQGNKAFFLAGILDEIRIHRSVLSADEIKLMYESQRPGSRFVDITN
jgi:hypothetical protein